jgi:hypothetical protein
MHAAVLAALLFYATLRFKFIQTSSCMLQASPSLPLGAWLAVVV